MSTEPSLAEVRQQVMGELLALMDAALPDCYWRKRFLNFWKNQSFSAALTEWKTGPIKNPSFLAAIDAVAERILTDDSVRKRG